MFTTTVKQLPPLHWQITWWSFFCLCKIRFLPLWHWKARKVIPCSKAYLGYHETYIHLWWSCVLGGIFAKIFTGSFSESWKFPKNPSDLPRVSVPVSFLLNYRLSLTFGRNVKKDANLRFALWQKKKLLLSA